MQSWGQMSTYAIPCGEHAQTPSMHVRVLPYFSETLIQPQRKKRNRRTLALGHRNFMRALEWCVSGSALVFSASWEAELTQVLQRQSGGWCMNPGSELTPVASHLARTCALTCDSRQGSVFWISSYSLRIFSGRKNKRGWSLQVGWRLKKRSERIMLLSVICVSVGGYVCRCTSN